MASAQIPLRLDIVDSHTAGEPTRCVLSGLPDLGSGSSRSSLAERVALLKRDHDHLRQAILCEPRGSDVLVGAFLVEPVDPACAAGVIFFNNAGYLGMCGHGTIGVAVTLFHLGRIGLGEHRLETPVGLVEIQLQSSNRVTLRNVPAYRYRTEVTLHVPGFGEFTGDVAWGGNWFFLCGDHGRNLTLARVAELTALTAAMREALRAATITGAHGAEIDHIELFSTAHHPANHGRNFVLCPGNAYDRSPCGTGTSAKLACLAAAGHLEPGQIWRQEGILGTVFEASYQFEDVAIDSERKSEVPSIPESQRSIIPTITGSAWVTGQGALLFDPADPFRMGIPQ